MRITWFKVFWNWHIYIRVLHGFNADFPRIKVTSLYNLGDISYLKLTYGTLICILASFFLALLRGFVLILRELLK